MEITTNEAAIYQGLKEGLTLHEIARRIQIHPSTVTYLANRMKQIGLIQETGKQGKTKLFQVVPASFEVVETRRGKWRSDAVKEDRFLESCKDPSMNEEQLCYLKAHRNVLPRRLLARRLGISKLELNFALMKIDEGLA